MHERDPSSEIREDQRAVLCVLRQPTNANNGGRDDSQRAFASQYDLTDEPLNETRRTFNETGRTPV